MTDISDAPTEPSADDPEFAGSQGVEVVKRVLDTLTSEPGVYRMLDAKQNVLYVGKARNLKKRVVAYTRSTGLPTRILRMVHQTASMEIVTTHTEVEALLLEANLIKRLKPRYNVLLRDDKSFPYILIDAGHDFPRITKHRGARDRKGEYFGPFAAAGAVNHTLAMLARAFPLRTCEDNDFATRTRPCLQFQIKRCSAPCVGRISKERYGELVNEARDFLAGRNKKLVDDLSARMQAASDALEFEVAGELRDRIKAIAHITARQDINVSDIEEADVIAAHADGGQVCIQVFFFRAGRNFGNRAYFPAHARDVEMGEIMNAFIGQFYENRLSPRLLLLNDEPDDLDMIGEALSLRAGRKVEVLVPQRGSKRSLVEHALANARNALARRLSESASQRQLLEGLAETFGLDRTPERIEVYDNSHIQGAHAIGAMIVAGPEGFAKAEYRKFNIKDEKTRPGDDFAMMREVLLRRFKRLMEEDPARENSRWPDLVLIDGGKGQLSAAQHVLDELGLRDVAIAAISKGPDRNAGREEFHLPGREPFRLEDRHPVLYFLQRMRDEAHRFAIGTHRAKRTKQTLASPLDEVPGIGAARKRALLLRFGSARGVAEAGLADLEKVPGISGTFAQRIYNHFHS